MAPETIENAIRVSLQQEASLYELQTNVSISDSLQMSLGRVLTKNAIRFGVGSDWLSGVTHDELRHICDWLTVAHQRNEEWLSRRNDQGVPFKLAKFGTVAQILNEADKAMAKRRGDGTGHDTAQGTKTVCDVGDGWSVVRLLTPEALDAEGGQMGHCVGQGAYDYTMKSNFKGIYSLRDPRGKSHVTIEIDHVDDCLLQLKGKQNASPKNEYVRRLLGWDVMRNIRESRTELPDGFGLEKTRGLMEYTALQCGDVFEGNIAILIRDQTGYKLEIPSGVTIRGDVVVDGYKALRSELEGDIAQIKYPRFAMTDGVFVDGEIKVAHVHLDDFSANTRRLVVRNASIESLKEIACTVTQFSFSRFEHASLDGAAFSGSVEMSACHGVEFKPSTKVAASVHISGCEPKFHHDYSPVKFHGDVSISRLNVFASTITFDGQFRTKSDFNITESVVLKMPSPLNVGGKFFIKETTIDRWPETLNCASIHEEATSISSNFSPPGVSGLSAPSI